MQFESGFNYNGSRLMPATCQKSFSLQIASGDPLCDCFEADNTVVGQVSGNLGVPPRLSILAGLEPGYYELQIAGGAFELVAGQWAVNPTIGNPQVQYDFTGNPNPIQFLDSDTGDPGFPYPNEAAAVANYQTKPATMVTPTRLYLWQYGSQISMLTNAAFGPTGASLPVFNVMRVRKLSVPQPTAPQIQNLATFAGGRWTITYGGFTTADMTFAATAGDVQTALNNLVSIIADGGVTVVGNAVAGYVITWNANGDRAELNPQVTTISPGIRGTITVNQNGTGILPEIQTITMTFCGGVQAAAAEPVWPGTFPNYYLGAGDPFVDPPAFTCRSWLTETFPNTGPCVGGLSTFGSFQLNGFQLHSAEIRLLAGGLATSNGCGWALVINGRNAFPSAEPVWMGVKATGDTPLGTYTWVSALPWIFNILCPAPDQTHGVPQITLI